MFLAACLLYFSHLLPQRVKLISTYGASLDLSRLSKFHRLDIFMKDRHSWLIKFMTYHINLIEMGIKFECRERAWSWRPPVMARLWPRLRIYLTRFFNCIKKTLIPEEESIKLKSCYKLWCSSTNVFWRNILFVVVFEMLYDKIKIQKFYNFVGQSQIVELLRGNPCPAMGRIMMLMMKMK